MSQDDKYLELFSISHYNLHTHHVLEKFTQNAKSGVEGETIWKEVYVVHHSLVPRQLVKGQGQNRHICAVDQLEEALEGHFTTKSSILHQEPIMYFLLQTTQQFMERLDMTLNTSDTSLITVYPDALVAY
ncbi:hypothetical protein RRG08_060270 [Elysia crispata]|uniref:Uncharacterized protein n=1 Tax=Elysia crispata TaxID=231223 RepID=A0AAE1EBU5_9GAST|nr:hypothetical protein RRG08_060270 [Elysia crispata]